MHNTASPRTPDSSEADRRSIAERHLRVLVVEDFKTMRKMIAKILGTLNMQVLEAANGIEAIEVLDKEAVDLVFTDLVMPEMDGYELCEEVRRRPNVRHLPIIVISTHRDATYVIQALRCGADDYLAKPFDAPLAERVAERVMSNV
ncbi:MAG: response regulator [Phycisphaerae bacterium]|nr:response regulator [Phycisphaerae bacterium]